MSIMYSRDLMVHENVSSWRLEPLKDGEFTGLRRYIRKKSSD
jgi:hypothetical protein